MTGRQKESFSRLAANPESVPFIYRFALHIEEDFDLPAAAYPIYERAQALDTDETQLEQKITDALKRIKARDRAAGTQTTGSIGTLGTIAPESMGVKSPTHHRPSAAALIKRTGRLTVDRGRIQATTPTEVPWAETQKKLDEMMSRLVVQAATLCETAPRPMRLPRSIAPSQWLEFLEGHIALLVATLEAQDLFVETTVDLDEVSREDLGARADLVYALMEEIERGLASLAPRRTMPIKLPVKAASAAPAATKIEDIFDSIEGGALAEAETTPAQPRRRIAPEGPAQRGLVSSRARLPKQSRKQAGHGRLPARPRTESRKSPGLVQRRHDPA